MKKACLELIKEIDKSKIKTQDQLNKLKLKISKKYKLKGMPTNITILCSIPENKVKKYKKILITKPTRTISGVSVVAIMTKPYPCPHAKRGGSPCLMCPGGIKSAFGDVPQSYTGVEPATKRAIRNAFDPYLQVFNRLEQYTLLNQDLTKIEMIIMGGTFPSFPKKYQIDFITYSFKALNDFSKLFFKKGELNLKKFKEFFELPGDFENPERIKRLKKKILKLKGKSDLKKEQKKNETSYIRCTGLTAETRPDYGLLKQGNFLLDLGFTRVEVGVQSVYEESLKKIERGHTVKDSIKSIKILKDLGFKITAHYMLGLFATPEKDLKGLKELFDNKNFRPDMLKLYPCMVIKGTKLYNLWKQGKYKPLNTKQAIELISKFKKTIPEYCRVNRVMRDIPTHIIESGAERTNLRQYIKKYMAKRGWECRCIRCREVRGRKVGKIKILTKEYQASGGIEYFISAEDPKKDILIGLCRLRFPSKSLRKEITKKSALIRELHVYSTATKIGEKSKTYQHKGLGKKLLRKAEQIAKKHRYNKIVIISGIGVRGYYKKLKYKKQGPYMIKKI